MAWLLRDGEVLASLEVADDARRPPQGAARARRRSTARCCSCPARSVHSIGMRFPIDVAWLDGDLTVLRTARLAAPPHDPAGRCGPTRCSRPRRAPSPAGACRSATSSSGRTDRCRSSWWARPIGNLGDLSPRAVEALAAADAICCEDTRRTGRLLQHAGVARPPAGRRERPHRGAGHRRRARAAGRGERVAVVTDAGMPGISDPGERLVRAAVDAGHAVEVVPGPSAAVTALGRQRAADRPLRLRGVPAAQGLGADEPPGRARHRAAHDRALRGAPPARPHAGRPGRRAAAPTAGCRSAASSPSSTRSTGAARSPRPCAWADANEPRGRAGARARRAPRRRRPSTPSASSAALADELRRRRLGPRRRRDRRRATSACRSAAPTSWPCSSATAADASAAGGRRGRRPASRPAWISSSIRSSITRASRVGARLAEVDAVLLAEVDQVAARVRLALDVRRRRRRRRSGAVSR